MSKSSRQRTGAAVIPADARFTGVMAAREAIAVAGLPIAEAFFRALDRDVRIERRAEDGDRVKAGAVLLRIEGNARALLAAERSALNTVQHLSGIATATSRWVEALDGSPTRVLDTRKTLPGLRALQKYAVRCGGGVNHRSSLQDMAMVKDNHVIAAGGVLPALEAIRGRHPGLPVEVEVTTLDQLDDLLALPEPPERILLVGDEKVIHDRLAELGGDPGFGVKHASQVIGMGDSPATALRAKPDSSIVSMIAALHDGQAGAAVGMGNTGAVVAAATLGLGTLEGVKRPGIAVTLDLTGRRALVIGGGPVAARRAAGLLAAV